ncbi:MAG TPA: acetate--CoA ligase family protein [Stellaceae bacterium]|nr:acetate--CoA ligase family protein [Stellaceae bacterium]
MLSRIDISRLMRPRSIAIVGISPEPSSAGFLMLRTLEEYAYSGAIHLVSRNRSDVGGRACVKTIEDLPDGIDAAMLLIPRVAIEDAVKSCAKKKIGGIVIFSAGFGEAGGEWKAAQDRIAALAEAAGIALCGPNCLGIVDFINRIPLTFSQQLGPPLDVAAGVVVVAQSGGLAGVIRVALKAKDIPVTCTVSTGNEAVLGLEDYAGYLLEEKTTQVVACFAEQIRKPQRFLEVAARARALGKPIVLLHSGRSAAAQESAKSHTGALVGDYAVMQTVLAHHAVLQVESLEELVDVCELMMRFPTPPTEGCAMVTDSGAVKGMTLDLCDALGLDLPPLTPALAAQLQAELPDFVGASNPLDLTAQAITHPEMYERTMTPLLADARYGSLVLTAIVSSASDYALAKGRASLKPMLGATKPVIYAMLGDEAEVPEKLIAEARAGNVPFFRSPERAFRAIARVTAYGRALEAAKCRQPRHAFAAPPLPAAGTLTEAASKQYLAACGLKIPPGRLATSLAEAREAATALGYPLAAKLQAAALAHKSDIGGVVLNIADVKQLEAAWEKLQHIGRTHSLALDGVLVERMAKPGIEMILGARRDPQWGPVLAVGLGGIFAEAIADIRILPVGLDGEEIAAEIKRLRGAKLLAGYRGAPPADIAALADAVARLGQVMLAAPRLREIDINPLSVLPVGEGVLALDALIVAAP